MQIGIHYRKLQFLNLRICILRYRIAQPILVGHFVPSVLELEQ